MQRASAWGNTGEGPPLPTLKRALVAEINLRTSYTGEGPPLPTLKQPTGIGADLDLDHTGEGPPLPTLKPMVVFPSLSGSRIPERAPLSLH